MNQPPISTNFFSWFEFFFYSIFNFMFLANQNDFVYVEIKSKWIKKIVFVASYRYANCALCMNDMFVQTKYKLNSKLRLFHLAHSIYTTIIVVLLFRHRRNLYKVYYFAEYDFSVPWNYCLEFGAQFTREWFKTPTNQQWWSMRTLFIQTNGKIVFRCRKTKKKKSFENDFAKHCTCSKPNDL